MRTIATASTAVALGLLALTATGCVSSTREGMEVVMVVDVTASIEKAALGRAFEAITGSVELLARGDSLVVIPITGDAWDDSPRAILREQLKVAREPYDADVHETVARLRSAVDAMQRVASAQPAQHTDLLGALDLAADELSRSRQRTRAVIVVLSDFIQDDGRYDFARSDALASPSTAATLAKALARKAGPRFDGAQAYLGYLASAEGQRLGRARREAIQAFWTALLVGQGASVEAAIDGPGRLAQFTLRAATEMTEPRALPAPQPGASFMPVAIHGR